MMRRACFFFFAFALHFLATSPARAHKPSDAYLTLEPHRGDRAFDIEARWDIALRDLEYALHLDADDDGSLTWGELRAHRPDLEAYAFSRLTVTAGDHPCQPIPGDLRIVSHSDGTYAVLLFRLACERAPTEIIVKYKLFFDIDPQHHGLVRIRSSSSSSNSSSSGGAEGSKGERAAIFTAAAPVQHFETSAPAEAQSFVAAVHEGIGHIASGIDHLLFLLALLLPSVLRREDGAWRPVAGFRAALRDVLGIVTAFTVAHSITLSLAALDIVRLPSRLVESGIAASVVLAALNNLVPVFRILRGERWAAAFVLGLLHGFGFSAVLVDLGLARAELVRVLFGFNVGVELGQCAVVAAFLPLAYLVRAKPLYRQMALLGGSAAIAAVAVVWFVERAFIAT